MLTLNQPTRSSLLLTSEKVIFCNFRCITQFLGICLLDSEDGSPHTHILIISALLLLLFLRSFGWNLLHRSCCFNLWCSSFVSFLAPVYCFSGHLLWHKNTSKLKENCLLYNFLRLLLPYIAFLDICIGTHTKTRRGHAQCISCNPNHPSGRP